MRVSGTRIGFLAGEFLLVAIIVFAMGTPTSLAQNGESEIIDFPHYVPGQLIIKFKTGVSPTSPQVKDLLQDIKGSLDQKLFPHAQAPGKLRRLCAADRKRCQPGRDRVKVDLTNIWLVKVSDPNTDIELLGRYITKRYADLIEYTEPDYYAELGLEPDDKYYNRQGSWGQTYYWGEPYDDQWGLKLIEAAGAWDIATGDSSIVIAISDTGIDYNHPDLVDNIWMNPGEIPGNNEDDDSNGYVDDVYGWDFGGAEKGAPEDNDPMDYRGHGTMVGGLASAVTNNSEGMAGAAWNVKLMAVKGIGDCNDIKYCDKDRFSSGDCAGTVSSLAKTITYATDNGAHIINMSWGYLSSLDYDLIRDAIVNAHDAGVVLVAISHNFKKDIDLNNVIPARWPEVISVGGVNEYDEKWDYACWGLSLDVVAPSGGLIEPEIESPDRANILSTHTTNPESRANKCNFPPGPLEPEYALSSGTSLAAPLVSGLAALIKAHHPEYSSEQIRQVIRISADDIVYPFGPGGDAYPGFDRYTGYGRINAFKALCDDPADPDCAANPVRDHIANPQEALILSPLPREIVSPNFDVDVDGIASGPQFEHYKLEYGEGEFPQNWTLLVNSNTSVYKGRLGSVDFTNLPQGPYTIRLTVFNTEGYTFIDRVTVVNAGSLRGFPTPDLNDGKFVTLVGDYTGTKPVVKINFWIGVEASQKRFKVEVFDGDQGTQGAYGRPFGWGFADWCRLPIAGQSYTHYTLYADPLKNGEGTYEIVSLTEDPLILGDFLDNDITTIYDGKVHDDARQTPDGNYFYRLEVVMGPDKNTPNEEVGCANGFKVLSDGQIGILFDDIQFHGVDADGKYIPDPEHVWADCAPKDPPPPERYNEEIIHQGVDTLFDGQFLFFFYVPPTVSSFALTDSDADFLCDGTYDGAVDPSTPGNATGENDSIKYGIWNPKGDLIRINIDPSGSYWLEKTPPDMDEETKNAFCPGGSCLEGYYQWGWYDVFAINIVHIDPPFTFPPEQPLTARSTLDVLNRLSQEVVFFEFVSEPYPFLPVSSAVTTDYWIDEPPSRLKPYLPLVLGRLDSAGKEIGASQVVRVPGKAQVIFTDARLKNHWLPERLRRIYAELLAVKLNLARAAANGEPLHEASIIGSPLTVEDLVELADGAISSIQPSRVTGKHLTFVLTEEEEEILERLTVYLELVNEAKVTFVKFQEKSAGELEAAPSGAESSPEALSEETPG